MKDAPAVIYASKVMHRRLGDGAYRFVYRVFSLLVDVDRLPELDALSPFFSVNRFNLLSFHEADHLPQPGLQLRDWIDGVLESNGIPAAGLRVRLLCFPRILGIVFNPLCIWYCEAEDGSPRAVLCEVRNTFGERHCYLLKPESNYPEWPLRQSHAKEFHVSPFIGMQADYHFRLARPNEKLSVHIRETSANQLMLVTCQTGVACPFSSLNLLWQMVRVPWQTVKVLAAIHWQALKIWLRGTPFHSKPAPPMKEVT